MRKTGGLRGKNGGKVLMEACGHRLFKSCSCEIVLCSMQNGVYQNNHLKKLMLHQNSDTGNTKLKKQKKSTNSTLVISPTLRLKISTGQWSEHNVRLCHCGTEVNQHYIIGLPHKPSTVCEVLGLSDTIVCREQSRLLRFTLYTADFAHNHLSPAEVL